MLALTRAMAIEFAPDNVRVNAILPGAVDTPMLRAGMNIARLNFSHGDREDHRATIRRVREAADRAGRPVGILQDLGGPKIRLGSLPDDGVVLETGATVPVAEPAAG